MYNILICDDDRDIVAALKIYLSSQKDYRLFEAYTGKQALEAVKNNDIQLVLLDIMMPEMDGFQVLGRLQGDESARDIPVVFLTADEEPETRARAEAAGVQDIVMKPFRKEELLSVVAKYLG